MKFIDKDGEVWEETAEGYLQQPSVGRLRQREYVERMWGPLRPLPPNDSGEAIIQLPAPAPAPVEFNHWYNPGTQLVQCLTCGALVGDQELHAQWHATVGNPGILILPEGMKIPPGGFRPSATVFVEED